MGKNIENMLSNKKSSSQFLREREEAERQKLRKMIYGDSSEENTPQKRGGGGKKGADDDDHSQGSQNQEKVLRITRTFKNKGKEYTRTEVVRKPLVIEAYIKVRETKDENFIRQFATIDDSVKEEMKKEKRRIQEQLRRIKRNQEKEKQGVQIQKPTKKSKKQPKKADLKLKCGACGGTGHMKTNKACPRFVQDEFAPPGSINVAMTEKDEEELGKDLLDVEKDEELVNIEGTKMKVSTKVFKHMEDVKRKTMIIKVPKNLKQQQSAAQSAASKRRRAGTVEHCDYLSTKNKYKSSKRRRTDPYISLASFLEEVHLELRKMDEAQQFLQPVNPKKIRDYHEKVSNPMDLQTVRENIQQKKYR